MDADSHVIAVLEDDDRRVDAMRHELERLLPGMEASSSTTLPGRSLG